MHFQNPHILMGLWLLPVVAGLLVYAQRKRRVSAERFVDAVMVARLMPAPDGPRPWIKGALVLAALALLIMAAARPMFGEYFEKVEQRGVDMFVLLDVSRSMTAEDVTPSRLARAKSDIRDLLASLPGDRVGLVVFAGKPALKVPLTTDRGFFETVLEEIDSRSAPRGGTLIGDGLRKCIEAMPKAKDRDQAIVLITDGEDHESLPLEAAKNAAERGIRIFTVGLGDKSEGARVPVRDEQGNLQYLKADGREVWSKMDENLLREIALATGGACIPAGTAAYDLGQVYKDHLAGLNRGEFQTAKKKQYHQQFQIFLALGILCLAVETAIPSCRRKKTPLNKEEAIQ
jgi:Ca-activated chloride channel homolog